MKGMPRVAVLGGLPSEGTLAAGEFELIGEKRLGAPDRVMDEYQRTVVNTVRMVAPKAKFVFTAWQAQSGQMSNSDLLRDIDALAAAKPDVLLITMGPLKGVAIKTMLAHVAPDILIVNAAGNEGNVPLAFEGDPVLTQIATVASIGSGGDASPFTQRGANVFWAPGEKIPVKVTDERLELRDGTTYSAALMAGIAARIMAEYPNLKPTQLLSTLRETAHSTSVDKPRVVNLTEALKRLQG